MSQTRKRVHILPNFSRKEILQTSAEKSNKLQELNISVSSQNNRLTSLQLKNSSPGVTPKSTKARIKQQRFPSPYAKPRISLNRSFSSSAMKRNKSDDTFMTPQRGKDRMQSLALDFSQYNTLNHEVLQQNSTITHKLNEQLAKLTPANVEKQFYLCKEAFQDIVEAMKPNSSVLESIKRAYDLMIDEKDAMIEAQRRQINDFRGITQASTRASDASRTQLTKYMDVPQQRLKKGGREDSIKLDKMSIEDQVQELNSQLQDLQTREKNYQNCISELIKRGYPVNQI